MYHLSMAEPAKLKQKTPKGHEIPVPKLSDVHRDLRKVAKGKRSTSDRAKK